jgi:hypothetical protein
MTLLLRSPWARACALLLLLAACAPACEAQASPTWSAPVLPTPTVLMCGTVPALEVLFQLNPGAEIVGALSELLGFLKESLCPLSAGLRYDCAEYEANRLALWQLYGNALCGFPAGAWNGTANVRDATPDQALEFLLSQCLSTFTGDLAAITSAATVAFITVSTQSRQDVAQVIAANALKAGVNVTAELDLSTLYPPIVPSLAPVPAAGREPAVLAAAPCVEAYEFVPSNPGLFDAGVFEPYAAQRYEDADAAVDAAGQGMFPAVSDPDGNVQSTAALAALAQQGAPGRAIYQGLYLANPSPEARYQSDYCASQAWDSDVCFPALTPRVGLTHDAYGNRLLSDRGQAVPPYTADVAGVPQEQVVPPGAFTAPTPFTLAHPGL